jgi:tetratricopeptide (TPR) repeat protein
MGLEQQGRNAEAEEIWLSIAQASPKDGEALAHLGLLEARQEHYDAAAEYDRQALAANPDLPGVQLNLGLALFKAGKFSQAMPSFVVELKKHPGDERMTILLGMCHYGMGDYLVAVPYLQKAAASDPQNLELRLTLAHSCLWSKQYKCVADVGKEMLALNPDSPEADMLTGEALDEQGDDAGAIAQFRAAVQANPKQPNAHFGLGYLLWKKGQFRDAAAEFAAEVQNDPGQSQARAYLGDCYVQTEEYDKAEPELLRAVEDSPTAAMAHRDLGVVYAKTDRSEAAIKELEKAITLDGRDASSHFQLARAYQAMGRVEEAKAEFVIASKMNRQADEALTQKMSAAPGTKP